MTDLGGRKKDNRLSAEPQPQTIQVLSNENPVDLEQYPYLGTSLETGQDPGNQEDENSVTSQNGDGDSNNTTSTNMSNDINDNKDNGKNKENPSTAHKYVDNFSLLLFPVLFAVYNVIYWRDLGFIDI